MQRLPVEFELEKESRGLRLGDYLSVFVRRIWLIIIPFVLCLGAATALGFLITPQYKSSTSFELVDSADIDRELSRAVGGTLNLKSRNAHVRPEIIRRSFLTPIVDKNGINEGFDVSSGKGREALFLHIYNALDVSLITSEKSPDIVTINYRGRDPIKVTNFVNDIRQAYCTMFITQLRGEVLQRVQGTRKQLQEARREVETAANLESEHNRSYGIAGDLDAQLLIRSQGLADMRGRLEELLSDLKSKQEKHETVKRRLLLERPMISGTRSNDPNPKFVAKKEEIRLVEEVLARLKQNNKLETHPDVIEARQKLSVLGEELGSIPESLTVSTSEVTNKTFENLREQDSQFAIDIKGLEAEINALRKSIETETTAQSFLPEAIRISRQLRGDRVRAEENLKRVDLSWRTGEAMWERVNSDSVDIFRVIKSTLVEDAVHQSPVFPNVTLFVGAGGFVGLLLGIGLAFLVEFSTSSFVTVSQVQRTMGVPMLGYVKRIESSEEIKKRRIKAFASWGVFLLLALIVGAIHFAYFNKAFQVHLPPWLFDSLKRIYGAR
jgi:uncharacterized protein involved in exopolysaccharide biosynthesis